MMTIWPIPEKLLSLRPMAENLIKSGYNFIVYCFRIHMNFVCQEFYGPAMTMAGALSVSPVHLSIRTYVLRYLRTYIRLSDNVPSLSQILLIRICLVP